jgi:hypothetical protein
MSGHTSPEAPRQWRVTVIEWLSHVAVIEADTAEQDEAEARSLWAEDGEQRGGSGIDGVVVDEALPLSGVCRA